MKNLRTYAEINLDAIAHNVREMKRITSDGVELIAVVKADGYGHGAVMTGKVALEHGANRLAVAFVQEGIELRQAGIDDPIIVLGYTPPVLARLAVENRLTVTVYSQESVDALAQVCGEMNTSVKVHVKIDTGMSRIGIQPEDALGFIRYLTGMKYIEVEGVYTHFAAADEQDKSYTELQFSRFAELLNQLEEEGIHIPIFHVANSAAIIDLPSTHLNAVRAGIALYGLWPSPEVDHNKIDLIPAMEFKTRVTQVKSVPKQMYVSYGRTYQTSRQSLLATLSVGYADGYTRMLSGKAEVLMQGQRVPVVGRITMDQCVVDVTGLEDVKVGDEAVLFGHQGGEVLPVDQLAGLLNTINYELICMIGKRVPRIYYKNGQIIS